MLSNKYLLEALSYIFILVIAYLLLNPIMMLLNEEWFKYLWRNFMMIFIFFSYIKFIFFRKYLFYSDSVRWKIASILSAIPAFFFFIDSYFYYFDLFDDSSETYFQTDDELFSYWRVVSLLSVVTGVVSTIALLISMVRHLRPK